MAKKTNATTNNAQVEKEVKTMAKKATTKKAAPEKTAEEMIREDINKTLDDVEASQEYLIKIFGNAKYGTFNFDKLRGAKVVQTFLNPAFRKNIQEIWAVYDEYTELRSKYASIVDEILDARKKAELEANKAKKEAEALEKKRKAELIANFTADQLEAIINKGGQA